MDSVTQIALGAAVAEATLGQRVGNRALLWGGILGTLPDLDVFIPLGDVVRNFTFHRAASHSFFILALLTPLMVWLITKIHTDTREYKTQWYLLVYLVFVTHILLDSFTAYGTQIFWPFVTTPMAWSTIFIIDPMYTLPLLVGIISALVMTRNSSGGHRINQIGLILSTLYLGWSVVAKSIVDNTVDKTLSAQKIKHTHFFTTPAPFNTLLWRTVVMDETGYYEGFYSLFDKDEHISFTHYPSNEKLLQSINDVWVIQRLKWFSKGFYSVSQKNQSIVISDLRMGVEPDYVFRFNVANVSNPHAISVTPELLPVNRDLSKLKSMWQRIWIQPTQHSVNTL